MKKWILILLCLLTLGTAWGQEYPYAAGVQVYFDTYNSDVAETPYTGKTARKFSWVQKVTAFDRDGWKCVVCGATNNLEMDHAVALMNGGPNDLTNLYCLCHSCHVAKTRLDYSMRKYRKQLARSLEKESIANGSPVTPGG